MAMKSGDLMTRLMAVEQLLQDHHKETAQFTKHLAELQVETMKLSTRLANFGKGDLQLEEGRPALHSEQELQLPNEVCPPDEEHLVKWRSFKSAIFPGDQQLDKAVCRPDDISGVDQSRILPAGQWLVGDGDSELSELGMKRRNHRVFADSEAMKEAIRQKLTDPPHDVTELFHTEGFAQHLARSQTFENITLLMVCVSSVWLGVDIDFNKSETLLSSAPHFQLVAQLFCVFFVFECSVRFMAFEDKRNTMKEFAFVFDALLALLIVFETWVLPVVLLLMKIKVNSSSLEFLLVLRIVRLLRVLRLGRVLREIPELLVVIRGTAIAFRAILVVTLLLAVIIYMGGIFFTVILEGTAIGADRFSSVRSAMGTLLIEGTLSGAKGGPMIRDAGDESIIYSALLLVFVLLANITIMGVIGGLLVQTVKATADMEREEANVADMTEAMDGMWQLLSKHDTDSDGLISLDELGSLLSDRKIVKVLRKCDVDVESIVGIAEFIFEENGGALSKPEFKRMVLDFRGKNPAKVKDHFETRKFLASYMKKLGLAPAPNMSRIRTSCRPNTD